MMEAVMGSTWKPVQPTEIRDIRIIREVITQIRKPIPPEVHTRIEEDNRMLRAGVMTLDPEAKARAWAKMKNEQTDME
jgi:hypothetical protein